MEFIEKAMEAGFCPKCEHTLEEMDYEAKAEEGGYCWISDDGYIGYRERWSENDGRSFSCQNCHIKITDDEDEASEIMLKARERELLAKAQAKLAQITESVGPLHGPAY